MFVNELIKQNLPKGEYRPTEPTDQALRALPWLIDKHVRHNRTVGFGADADRFLATVLGIDVPQGGFLASDGRNHHNQLPPAPRAIVEPDDEGDEDLDDVEDTVAGWSPEYAAEVTKALAARIA